MDGVSESDAVHADVPFAAPPRNEDESTSRYLILDVELEAELFLFLPVALLRMRNACCCHFWGLSERGLKYFTSFLTN